MIRNHSHYSLLTSISRSEQIVKTCKDAGYSYAGITDVSTISGCVNFIQACKKGKIKPVIGTEIALKSNAKLTLICKNNNAWNQLLMVISRANDVDNHDGVARISMDELFSIISPKDFVCIDGYVGSELFLKLFPNSECVFETMDAECIKGCVDKEWKSIIESHVKEMSERFGDYYLEVNKLDSESFPISMAMADLVQEFDSENRYCIPDSSTYYPERQDAVDHRVLICTKLKTTMRQLEEKINTLKDLDSLRFIRSSCYHVKSKEVLSATYAEKQLQNLQNIVDACEDVAILSNPKLPSFQTPSGNSEGEYLKQLCRDGWKKLVNNRIDESLHTVYKDRVLKELEVIEKANLAGYFLIVQDYVNHFRNLGCLVGPARGSGGGSLVCYLTGITLVDPIKFGLIFERFYNEGRNTEDHISLPDIDVDFPPSYRDAVVEYLKDKYGKHRVCQMLTFGRLAGRSIIKEVLRVNELCGFEQMNQITDKIPNEASISDLLEEMDNPSVIRWALENDKNSLIDYCWLDDNGELQGEYAKVFEQAMRMEGVFKTQGKHAAGVVIALKDLNEVCPMIKSSRGSEKIAGMEMGDLEAIGCVKFDILGVSALEKIAETIKEINEGL